MVENNQESAKEALRLSHLTGKGPENTHKRLRSTMETMQPVSTRGEETAKIVRTTIGRLRQKSSAGC